MAKKITRSSSVDFAVTIAGTDALWARNIEPTAKAHEKSLDTVFREALHDWLWHASGLKRLFDQVREAGDLMKRSFLVEGMLVGLARSSGLSIGQQSEYLKRAQDERALYEEQRKNLKRLVREIRRVAEETGLPEAIAAADKLIVPD